MVERIKYKISCEQAILWGLIFVMSLINLSLINNDSVWCDEAFTMIQCRSGYGDMIKNVRVDSWPPFYGITSWAFAQIFGATVPVLKIFSTIPGILTMILGATILWKEFKSIFASSIFILLNGIMPISLHMNVEVRGYSWGLYFVTFTGLLAYRYYKYGHRWRTFITMIFVSLLGAYTHYFTLLSIALIYVFLFIALIKKNRKNFWICVAITVICFLAYCPWLVNFFNAAQSVASGYWMPEISFSKYLTYFLYPFTNYFDNFGNVTVNELSYVLFIWVVFIGLQLLNELFRHKKSNSPIPVFCMLCISVWFLTITIGFLLSKYISPMFIARYMYSSVGLLWIYLALGTWYYLKNRQAILIVFSMILSTGMCGYIGKRQAEYETGTDEAKKVIKSNYDSGDGIFSDSDYLNWTEIKYYFPDSFYSELGGDLDIIMDSGNREKFLFLSTTDFQNYQNAFIENGYDIEYLGNYNFDSCYYFDLYKVYR